MCCFDVFRISFGLAKLGVSKNQHSAKDERDSVVQNCSNLENGSFKLFNWKKYYINAYTLLTLAYRIFFVAWEAKWKLIIPLENLRAWSFPLDKFFPFGRFMCCLTFFILCVFKENSVGIQYFIFIRSFHQNKVFITSLSGWNVQPSCYKGSDQCALENLPAEHDSISAWLFAGCHCPVTAWQEGMCQYIS